MKKFLSVLLVLSVMILFTGCETKKEDNKFALEFKEEHEALNGKVNKNGKEHRTISIDKDNPFVKTEASKVVSKIKDGETFYLYVGDPLCPWCRSVLEKAIDVSKSAGVKEILYIDIWDDEGNEKFRDKYELQKSKPVKIYDGASEYAELLNYFDSVLSDYTLTDSNGKKVSVGEKRIFAPNFFYVENGRVEKMVEGISDKQSDARGELTAEILKDEQTIFEGFFKKK